MHFEHDVVVVGGCGHVGLPLGLAFADSGLDVLLYDTNAGVVDLVNAGSMPFPSAARPRSLDAGLGSRTFRATTDPGGRRPQRTHRGRRGNPGRPLSEPGCRGRCSSDHAAHRPPRRRSARRAAQHRLSRGHGACCAADREARGAISTSASARSASRRAMRWRSSAPCPRSSRARLPRASRAPTRSFAASPRRPSSWSPRRRSWPSSSPTAGDISSSPSPTSFT